MRSEQDVPSGRFVIRAPKRLHAALRKLAERGGVPMNQLVSCLLAEQVAAKEALEFERLRLKEVAPHA